VANTNHGNNGFKVASGATTQGPFNLLDGRYGISVSATAFGTPGIALQILGPDAATYVNARVTRPRSQVQLLGSWVKVMGK
jgi:hypothetical protein